MIKTHRDFQIFVKPAGPSCNLDCHYCYYLKKQHLYPQRKSFSMPDVILEEYIVQHIEACSEPEIRFSWHGGEPTILGLDFFNKIIFFQRKHQPQDKHILNGMQTNGTLLNDIWCRFLADHGFFVGISIDGPKNIHNLYRVDKKQKKTLDQTMKGYELLQKHGVSTDILCVVNNFSVHYPSQIYSFFRKINASYVSFLPIVERDPDSASGAKDLSVPADLWGDFLCTIFDEWVNRDIGRIKIQIFEEALRTAFNQEHSLCIFRPVCGDIPVIEHNGDFYSCDHFVDRDHHLGNIIETHLVDLLESPAQRAFGESKLKTLPLFCRECEVRSMCNGGCPKNRFIQTPKGESGLNYLCTGYKKFFTYCQPFVNAVAAEWKKQNFSQ